MAVESTWTEERIILLRKLWGKGMSITKIGVEMGVTRNAIAGKSDRLKLPKRPSPIKKEGIKPDIEETTEIPLRMALRKIKWSRLTCVWPSGDPKTVEFNFCGKVIHPGKPYCPEHCDLAYTTSRDGS